MPSSVSWLFPPFHLDPDNNRLTREGEAIMLRPRTYAVLCVLVERHGQLIDKNQLLDAVWGHRYVGESVLEGSISEIRKVFGDDAKAARYVETVPRRGYRFIAAVRQVGGDDLQQYLAARRGEGAIRVGREALLQQVQAGWRAAQDGERQLLMLSGEAGLGKTTLLEMFLATTSNVSVLWGQCVEHFGAGEAFLPLLGALQQAGPTLSPWLRAVAPTWLLQLTGLIAAEERQQLQREVLGATRERMLREGCELLEAASADRPLIVVLEDLHWSDVATLELLAALGRRRGKAALLVLGSYRPSDAALKAHSLTQVRQELLAQRLCSELPLDTFSLDELRAYLARRFSEAQFPEDVARLVHRRSGGHPLFVVNLIDYLLAEGKLKQSGGWWRIDGGDSLEQGIPQTIQALIERQLDRLGEDERQLLEVASAAGSESSASLLAAGLEQDPLRVEAVCETLARRGPMLTAAGIAEWPDGTLAGNYAFCHALYAEVLYERLSPAYRVALHRRLGERLETAYGESSGEVAAELARHFEQGRQFAKAVHYLKLAAHQAERRFANREVLGYLDRAIALLARLQETQRVGEYYPLLQWSAAVRCSMYQMQEAIRDLSVLLDCAVSANDKLWEVKALVDLSRMFILVDTTRCLELVDEALEKCQSLPDENLKRLVKGYHAHWHVHFEWRDEYLQSCREAVETARTLNSPRILSQCLSGVIFCENYRTEYISAASVALESMHWAECAGDGYLFMSGQVFRALAFLLVGEWGETRKLINAGLMTAEKNGNPMQSRRFRILDTMLHIEAGDFAGARHLGENLSMLMTQGGDPLFSIIYLIQLAKIYLGMREYDHAQRYLAEITRQIEKEGLRLGSHTIVWFPWTHSEYWLAVGDLAKARQAAEELRTIAAARPERTFLALAYRLFAQISLAEHAWEQAEANIARALSIIENASLPLAAWRVYATAGDLCAEQGCAEQAQSFRRQAAAVLQQLTDSFEPTDPLRESLLAHPLLQTERLAADAS